MEGRKVFAHRYKYSHEKRRKQLRKACNDGLVQLIESSSEGFLYAVPDEMAIYDTKRQKLRNPVKDNKP